MHFHLLYGLAIWGSTFPSYLNKLASLQNKAAKIVAGSKYRDHVTSFYSQLNVLKLSDLFKHETAKIVHRHLHFHLSPLLSPRFISSLVKYPHESPEQSTLHAAIPFTFLTTSLIDGKEV